MRWLRAVLDGRWITEGRVTAGAILLALASGVTAALIAHGVIAPILAGGTVAKAPDFVTFWATSALARAGTASAAYDWAAQHAAQEAAMGVAMPSLALPWWYPPHALLAVWPLSALPLWWSMAVFDLASLALFLWAAWRIAPRPATPILAFAASATGYSLAGGQLGLLVAALLGMALLALERRPALAGAALALASVKPPVVLAVPVVLAAAGRWRALLAGAATLAALLALATLAAGAEVWPAFLGATASAGAVFRGAEGWEHLWPLYLSAYGAARHLGASFEAAVLVHAALALPTLAACSVAWRSDALAPAAKAALLCFAAAVVTPRLYVYDGTVVVLGAAFLVRDGLKRGFPLGERPLLLAVALADHWVRYGLPGAGPLIAPALFWWCLATRLHRARVGQSITKS